MSGSGETLVFDIETNGLLNTVSMIHCIVTQEVSTGEVKLYYGEREIYNGLLSLYHADCIIGHNIISYDIPAIRKFYPKWNYKSLYDTFILSCLFDPDRRNHTIESYSGGQKVANSDWSCLTYNMIDRCVLDVMINTRIWMAFKERTLSEMWAPAISLEQEVAGNHSRQVAAGVDFDGVRARRTIECLDAELGALIELIEDRMTPRCVEGGAYKRIFKKDGTLLQYVTNYFEGDAISIREDKL